MAKRLVLSLLMVCVLLFQGQPSRIGSGATLPGLSDAVAAGPTARFSAKAVSDTAHSAGRVLAASIPGTNPNTQASTSTVSSTSSNTALAPFYSVTGQVSDSIDGVGTLADSGTIRVQKPAEATVRAAFLLSASTGFTNYQIPNGDVQLNGTPVNWNTSIVNSIGSYNYLADVTSIVQPVVDAAVPGIVTFTVSENDTGDIDGEILAVVFNDPSQLANNAVSLLFGAQNVNGDTFNLSYTTPISTTDPNFRAIMSLGISYGYQAGGTQQYSIVNVNGQRMTTSAGGEDDWQGPTDANGALLTVGGIGDSTSNPPDPYATPTNPRSDDELYDLTPFMKDGDTSVSVFTQNPSNDDNIFFAAFLTNPPVSVGCNALAAPSGGSAIKQAAVTAQDLSARTADLADQDTETEHDTQQYPSVSDPNPPIDAQLFNAPVAYPYPVGWQTRDTRLVQSGDPNMVSTAYTPFTATVSLTANDPSLVSLTNEEGVPLAIGVSTIDGTPPAAVAGSVMADTVTYPAVATCESLTVRAGMSGADLGIVANGAGIQGAATLALVGDANTTFAQDSTGPITVTETFAVTDRDGSPDTDTEPAYFIEQPVAVDSSPDPARLAATGPVTMTLGVASAGTQTISLQVDPAWLQDPGRVFPVHIDVPIVTADSAILTQVAGTLNSCQPDDPMPATDVAVGAEGSCTYHGQEFFDVGSLPSDATVQSATLYLFTPDSTGPTDLTVYGNGPAASYAPLAAWQPPTWNTAPPIAVGATGITQAASDGHWQSWDVTGIVQGWQGDYGANNGLTLAGTGAPIRIASASGAGSATPDTAPYLSVVYSPAPTIGASSLTVQEQAVPASARSSLTLAASGSPGDLADGAKTIYGVSGSFNPDVTAAGDLFSVSCSDPSVPGCNDALNVGMASDKLGGQYIRFGVHLACAPDSANLPAWWNGPNAVKAATQDPNDGTVWDILASAHAAGHRIIPIVNLLPSVACYTSEDPATWYIQAKSFAQQFVAQDLANWNSSSDWIDFEIGNEENTRQGTGSGDADLFNNQFSTDFAQAVKGLVDGLGGAYAHYVIMPGGVARPTAASNPSCRWKNDLSPTERSIVLVQQAINAAVQAEGQDFRQHLAVAVHPYTYATPGFRNFSQYDGQILTDNFRNKSQCFSVASMLKFWLGGGFSTGNDAPAPGMASLKGLPLFFTEVDWDGTGIKNADGTDNVPGDWNPRNKGSYLVDLFTWLNDSRYHTGNPSQSPLRVLWFDGANFDDSTPGQGLLGIYDTGVLNLQARRGELPVTIPSVDTDGAKKYRSCVNLVKGTHNMSRDFFAMRTAACW